ncbi:60S ribosomal protein L9, putative [Trypanosoma brucei gambiense DAL972]|uniref:60S ribosomal protein L9, putative n=3 Tax=Trypanosoma brucei TaxID=5691 RepID=Q38CD0_TRYB2|nr:60S ribosomal protein L9, putative [Trypanosoma brucei gambiense DAL972]XP_011777315.1 60S ribosomal protein L9, putative [Trypanosoma brucei gambiense DAL972]XP_822368.1 60S ribosomal protein L9, putative [Trypanosoma brucei brucei TREU927]4V8M_By Chain By, 60S RIBOSOMAL PROTEIN L9, PUTATIVE [Trypanosoma brucei brucei TREU927]8OVA_By Chain By, 60S ribosomal protein L9, putative [Trypanosoma brucei brucei]8OVE_By Chain By, 60S ribosomal protein L9, putative [Trypanosoma brucei brucei]RHW69|eukprot:XP_011774258.1 60S ribosomal protein L9, putative [Trypanosoma brucei gambiense DAL972]
MKIKSHDQITFPEDVTVSVKDRIVTVKGKRGTLTKDLRHLQLDFRVNKKLRTFTAVRWFGNKINNSTINTALSHVRNMITGVTKGFRFKVRFAYAHFPISVTVENQLVEIRNFLGEKRVRRQVVADDVKVYRTDAALVKDELVLEGNDLEQVSREAAVMHQLCLVKKKDIRKFLDGIYVQTKTNIEVDE